MNSTLQKNHEEQENKGFESALSLPLNQKQIERGHELGDWFIFRETRHFGPLTTKQINQLLLSRLISNSHHIWRPGLNAWMPIHSIENFRAFGRQDIEKISDNDFSYQAQLGPIDRLKFQENDISFQDLTGTKTVYIQSPTSAGRFSEQKESLIYILKPLYHELLFHLGIKDSQKRAFNFSMGLLGLFLVGVMAYGVFGGTKEDAFVHRLPKKIRQKLIANANLPETTSSPNLVFFEQDSKLQDPVFVGSVNLPLGSRLKIQIDGIEGTLLGVYRFSKEIEMTITSPYFQTEPIRGLSGQYLSPGKYNVSVTCLSCQKENLNLFSSVFSFGIKNQESYKKDLAAFHINSRDAAILELDELRDLNETLLDQFQNTVSVYNRSIGFKSKSGWDKFSTEWLSTQKKIVELFEQIQSEDLKSKLYYLSLYEAYANVTRMIFEIHVSQDKHISSGQNQIPLIEQIAEMTQQTKLKLTYLKSQTDLMRINYGQSTGLPSTEGLNLDHFE